MNLHSFVLFICKFVFICNVANTFAYTIPDVKVDLLSNGFRVSIPDEPGISKVFYIMEITGKCSSMMEYVQQPVNGNWTTEQKNTKLLNNDELAISLLVQHGNDIIKAIKYLKIENNEAIAVNAASTADVILDEQCSANDVYNLIDVDTRMLPTTTSANTKTPAAAVVASNNNGNCIKSQSITNDGAAKCVDDLLFSEDFNDRQALSSSRWQNEVRLGLNDFITEEFVSFTDNADNCYVANGYLNIKPTLVPNDIRAGSLDFRSKCTSANRFECSVTANHRKVKPPVNTAAIHTNNSFSFTYGRVEVRAKLPKGDWLLPYIVLQPKIWQINRHVPQLRVAFAYGNEHLIDGNEEIGGSRLFGGAITWRGQTRIEMLKNTKHAQHFGDDFHTYTLTWRKNSITMAVDGETYGEITEAMPYLDQKYYILLSVSVGGHLEFSDTAQTGTKQRVAKPWINQSHKAALLFWRKRDQWYNTWYGDEAMQVDYVHVYAV